MSIKVFWWKEVPNFGDWITPYLLEKLGVKYECAPLSKASLIAVGSILNMALNVSTLLWRSKKLVVLGSGLMFDSKWPIMYYLRLRFLDIRLVRGPLTKRAILKFINQDIPCGDPALLASSFYDKKSVKKSYAIGLIPHHSRYSEFSRLILPLGWLLIDPRRVNCEDVFKSICQCDLIVSESLHGLVVSDSFEIPNVWLYNRDLHIGGNFKFLDYFLSIGRPPSLCFEVNHLSQITTSTQSELISQSFQINHIQLQDMQEAILWQFNQYINEQFHWR